MSDTAYEARRGWLRSYFGSEAAQQWRELTGTSPVSRIRETVRAGRAETAATLLRWLPSRMEGLTVLDAGCGPGDLAAAMAKRGATVTAVDLSEALVDEGRTRHAEYVHDGRIRFVAGDMRAVKGPFDHVVAMDSFIHYDAPAFADLVAHFGALANRSLLFTHAPWTPALAMMGAAGRAFPRSDRAPAIRPLRAAAVERWLGDDVRFADLRLGRRHGVRTAFYKSDCVEVHRP